VDVADPGRLTEFRNGGLVFDVVDSGPIDGEIVVLLHGFPQSSASWDTVRTLLNERGHRTVAPDQRGYSPGARPPRRRDYRISELVRDTIALIDALDAPAVHLVGHDWGAAVAWVTAMTRPTRVRTLTALSVPHPAALRRSMVRSAQLPRSFYMFLFQLPWLPERLFQIPGAAKRMLRWTGLNERGAERDARVLLDSAAATGGLNWYRALPLTRATGAAIMVTVPTVYVWSDRDAAVGRMGAELTGQYVAGPYEFRVLTGVSHWIPDEAPEVVAELVDQQITTGRPAAS
jgi:pimeloyl-ACP methyl ester carboxylesterase